MNFLFYLFASGFIITIFHFSLSTRPRDAGLMAMIGIFLLGGIIGWYLDTTIGGILIAVFLSLIFI